jgi:prephenate dehydrogenase
MKFKRVAIIGAGLIGGSFAMAARRAGLAETITAWDSAAALDAALSKGVIDSVEDSFEKGRISDADLIYLSAPVKAILGFLEDKGNLVAPGSIVTDSGSTKRDICSAAARWLPPGVHFIGGHPMAGSHLNGLDHASADLFTGAPYAIVADGASGPAVRAVIDLVRAIGGIPVTLAAAAHDQAVAAVSHAPQLLSTALAVTVLRSPLGGNALDLASTGFADMVRLAASPWSMWEDICRTNADNIGPVLAELARQIETFRIDLESGMLGRVEESFARASESAGIFLSRRTEQDREHRGIGPRNL